MTVTSDIPARPDALQLIGEMEGSGYRVAPSLVRRADGQTLQLTPLLYAVLSEVDGHRSYDEVAEAVARRTGKPVTADNVRTLVDEQLRPLGLLMRADGTAPEVKRSDPLLGLRAKVAVTDPERTRRITDPFARLFHPLVWVPVMAAFAWATWWVLFDKGLASATYEAFERPGLLLLVFAVTVLSAGFHEFGHAAGARRGGAQPGVMGAGIYLVWPAFYTDVTDSYRLGRSGRLRTDLGGLYFNAIVAVAIMAGWWLTGWDALLLVVATQILQMVRQLTPLVRFDGYHVLADATGVPDLFSRIGPTLASLWPTRWNDPRARELKPWARAVITVWVLAVVPLLITALVAMVVLLPRLAGTAWKSVRGEWAILGEASGSGDIVGAAAAALSMVVFAFPVLAVVILLARLVRSVALATWSRTEGQPARRGLAGLVALALVAGVAWAWWPDPDRYRPVLPFEGGTLTQLVQQPLARAGLVSPTSSTLTGGRTTTVLPADQPLPTEDRPVPAWVLVPSVSGADAGETRTSDEGAGSGEGTEAPVWVFPFDSPEAPEPGDNQAVAVNTEDGTVMYDIALAMVWVDGDADQPVANANEAYALASCEDCVTVAVAFQVVVIVGQADVVVPQNVSAAVNYDCFRCITAAVASQLVVTVDALPGEAQQVALADLWREIAAFAATFPQLSLSEITERLEEYKQQILELLGVVVEESGLGPAPADPTAPSATPTADSSATPTADPSATPTSDPTAEPSDGSSPGTGTSPSPTSGGTTSASPTSGSTSSPTAQPSSSNPSSSSTPGSSTSPTP